MNIAILLAAGSGSRMGLDEPKQFIMVNSKPLFLYALETLNAHKDIDKILVTTSKEHLKDVKDICEKHHMDKVVGFAIGGDSRQESVYNSLLKLEELGVKDDDIILIHDSARPLVSNDIIRNNIEMCKKHHAVDTVVPSSDTIIESIDGEAISAIPLRKNLYMGQTPQTFTYHLIKDVHLKAKEEKDLIVTDDCGLAIHFGYNVHLVQGNKRNFKVTTKEDLDLLQVYLNK